MTAIKGARDERLASIEQKVAMLRRDLEVISSRVGFVASKSNLRLAEIVNTPIDGDNTFEIKFVEGTFTETAGQHTPTYTDRSTTTEFAHNVAPTTTTPSSGDVVRVFRWSRRWWFSRVQ